MWNAYTSSNPALPGRDVRFEDVVIDGTLSYDTFESFTASVTQENGVAGNVEIAVFQVGDMITLLIPALTASTTTYTGALKSIPIPAAYRPTVDGLTQPILCSGSGFQRIGFCRFTAVTALDIYTIVTEGNPSNGTAATSDRFVISYFKSL